MKRLIIFCCCLAFLAGGKVMAQELNDIQTRRYHDLVEELRCLVCQNQNIAESNAPLAEDLKQQVQEMIVAGRSDAEIKDYLLARYGDFVLYRPPFKPLTWLLWLGPFLLLGIALFSAFRILRRGQPAVEEAVDPTSIARLLQEEKSGPGDNKQ